MADESLSPMQRVTQAAERYGGVFIAVGLVIFVVEMLSLVAMLEFGVDLEPIIARIAGWMGLSSDGIFQIAGTVGIAYAITRLIKPFSLALTLALTPPAARLWARFGGRAVERDAGDA